MYGGRFKYGKYNITCKFIIRGTYETTIHTVHQCHQIFKTIMVDKKFYFRNNSRLSVYLT